MAVVSDGTAVLADELQREYIVPSVFDKRVAKAVAAAVNEAAHLTGVSRRNTRDEVPQVSY